MAEDFDAKVELLDEAQPQPSAPPPLPPLPPAPGPALPPAPGPLAPLPPGPLPAYGPPGVPSEEKTLAMLAHVLATASGWLGPLIIYLTAEGKSYARSQAREALNFQITIAIATAASLVVSVMLMLVLIGFVLLYVLPLAISVLNLVLCIMAAVAASRGEDYRYPISLRLVR